MILRAAFWIGVVAVFMPHEPDLGFGRPSPAAFQPPKAADWAKADLPVPVQLCAAQPQACAGAGSLTQGVRDTILSNLDRVKNELKQARAEDKPGAGFAVRLPHF